MKVINKSGRSLGLPLGETTVLKPGEERTVDAVERAMLEEHPLSSPWLYKGLIAFDDAPVKKHKRPVAHTRVERDHDEIPPEVPKEGVVIYHTGGGWYRVYVWGLSVMDPDKKVRKAEAEAIAADYLPDECDVAEWAERA